MRMKDHFVALYREICKIPDLKDAVIHKVEKDIQGISSVIIEGTWAHKNLSCNNFNQMKNTYCYKNGNVTRSISVPSDKDSILKGSSANGSVSAHIMNQKEKLNTMLIMWENGSIADLVLKKDLHGKVYTDPELSAFVFTEDDSCVAYVAEKKRVETSSFFAESTGEESSGIGEEYAFIDEWGEQKEGYSSSCISIVNLKSLTQKILNVPEDVTIGDISWSPDGQTLFGVAYMNQAFRLGMTFCPIRESTLFQIDLNGGYKELTPKNQHVSSPRCSPDGTLLGYLRNPVGGPHVRCAQLCTLNLATQEERIVVDYVDTSIEELNGNEFFGFSGYTNIPKKCWAANGKMIVLSTPKQFDVATYLINMETGALVEVLACDKSVSVKDFKDGWLLLSSSSFTSCPQLLLTPTPDSWGQLEAHKWSCVSITEPFVLDGITCDWQTQWTMVNPVPHPTPDCSDLPIPITYLGPTTGPKRPLLLLNHGGPHSLVTNSFSSRLVYFLKLGYSIVIPNFRGSLGQGRRSIESLPGNIGTSDVSDVHQATMDCISKFGDVIDSTRVGLLGGSHGGFLVAHLSAQYPDFYKCVCTRNPVIELASMELTSDIPDWVFTESGLNYEIGKIATSAEMAAMHKLSPLSLIKNVKAPTLLQLGTKDKRVPYKQGLNYHKQLLAQGVPTKAYIYEDNHSLMDVKVDADAIIHQAMWLDTYLK